ncbi:uncharacterized protein LOC134188900 isoform X2 [Corticium candelabrum]|uniref:uncharacterized protein LOC134188900 isoform X2 n=1 Tax=Corticium candelabrum TaxID=121492 RepID=UPI002E25C97F|nr:uncharacterized protein LOC134188900 isoform X2 [Corticium candelabrum]
MIVMDALENNRIADALQELPENDCSVAACFTRMKVRETTVASDVYNKLDRIRGVQEDIELKLSQTPRLQELTASSSILIERLATKLANVRLLRKHKEKDAVYTKETETKKEVANAVAKQILGDFEKLGQQEASHISQENETVQMTSS